MDIAVFEDLAESKAQSDLDPDIALVESSASGDIAAFEELVRRYDRKLLRIAQQLTHCMEDAQDAVQETFLKVHRKLHQFQRASKFSTWLIRIVVNESLMKLRKRRYMQEVPLEYEGPDGESLPSDVEDWSSNPEQLYSRAELHEILRRALDELSPNLRVIFILRDIEGLSIQETVTIMNLHPNAVKARHHRARLHLRERLSKYFRKPSG